MNLRITAATSDQMKAKPTDESKLGFGQHFTDHIFLVNYEKGRGWHRARIEPYGDLTLNPAAMGLHYGQEIFEGLKAYRGEDNGLHLFRPHENYKRFNRSAARLCMPQINVDEAVEATRELVLIDRDWVPASRGTSLYIRPVMLATEPHVGVRPSAAYLFYIIIGPVGAYYPEGLNPVKIYVEPEYIRAAAGGVGEAKTAANYAASLLAAEKAKERGFSQVLWLDAVEKRYIEEVGTMNIFFVIGDEVITPPLGGSILPGVTRDTVLQLIRGWGLRSAERPITIDEVVAAARDGSLKEAFGTGTAAVISPVGQITFNNEDLVIAGGRMGELSRRLYDEIVAIQYGAKDDPYGWRVKIN